MHMMNNEGRRERRIITLIEQFGEFLEVFDHPIPPFSRHQCENHLATLARRREVGNSKEACQDLEFAELLHNTLTSWKIGTRGSVLVSLPEFRQTLTKNADEIGRFERLRLDDNNLDIEDVADHTWSIIKQLRVVDGRSLIASGSKTLHHLLPDLVPPMDWEWTASFFSLNGYQFRTRQQYSYPEMLRDFHRVAMAVQPEQFIVQDRPWRSSSTKILDNAVIGFMIRERARP